MVGIAVTGKILDGLGGGGKSWAWIVAMGTIGAVCGACGVFFVLFAKGNDILFPTTPANDVGEREGHSSNEAEDRNPKEKPRPDDIA